MDMPTMVKDADTGDLLVKDKDPEKTYFLVPITKGKCNIEICMEDLPADVYKEILIQGGKHFINAGMGEIKTTGLKDKDLTTAQKLAVDKGEENLEKIYSGKIRMTKGVRGAAAKADRVIMTEAMRVARLVIKQALKDAGEKVSHYSAKDISALAKEWLETTEQGKECIEQARETIKTREVTESNGIGINLKLIKPDEKLVKKAEEKKAKQAKPKTNRVTGHLPAKPKAEQHAQH